jgi:hypothetical protein
VIENVIEKGKKTVLFKEPKFLYNTSSAEPSGSGSLQNYVTPYGSTSGFAILTFNPRNGLWEFSVLKYLFFKF